MPKISIDKKTFNLPSTTDTNLIRMIEKTGAKQEVKTKDKFVLKHFSVDPYTIGIGIGAAGIGVSWIIYRVTQSQKNQFKNMFKGRLD